MVRWDDAHKRTGLLRNNMSRQPTVLAGHPRPLVPWCSGTYSRGGAAKHEMRDGNGRAWGRA